MCQHPVRHGGGVLGPRRGGAAVCLVRGGEADDDAECDGRGQRRPGPHQRAPQPAEPPARAGRGRADAAHTAQREPQHQLRRLLLIRISVREICYPLRYQ